MKKYFVIFLSLIFFVTPFWVVGYLLIKETDKEIISSERASLGASYHAALFDLMLVVQQYRGNMLLGSSDDITAPLKQEIYAKLPAVDKLEHSP